MYTDNKKFIFFNYVCRSSPRHYWLENVKVFLFSPSRLLYTQMVSKSPCIHLIFCYIFTIYRVPLLQHRLTQSIVLAADSSTDEGIFHIGFKHNLLPGKWIIFITLIKLFYLIKTFFIFFNVFCCCFFLITHKKN